MGEEGDFMAYSRVKKYQELRDGLKDEAGINKEQVLIDKTEDEDDDFLSFIKKDDHADKKANIEDTLTEPKTFEQMREESSQELEQALRSAKKGVGKESQYNTRMDILSKIRDGEKTTIKIDAVDQYSTDEFARGMFLNENTVENGETIQNDEPEKKMTLMEKLASISPEEDAKKAQKFLQEEREKEIEQESEENQEINEPELEAEEDNEIIPEEETDVLQEITKEFVQIEHEENHQMDDITERNKNKEKNDGKVVKILDVIITVLVVVLIILLCIIIYQNFF